MIEEVWRLLGAEFLCGALNSQVEHKKIPHTKRIVLVAWQQQRGR